MSGAPGASHTATTVPTPSDLHARLRREAAQFQGPILYRSLIQIATSFGGFFASCAAMYALLGVSYALTLLLAPLATGFLVRIFIIQHDCGHGSFLPKRWANDALGRLCSLRTLTPYANWRRQHACHARIAPLVTVPELSLWQGLCATRYALFDEAEARMVTFRQVAAMPRSG